MHPEDLPDPGTYVDPETGDIWEKHFSGKWYVNGLLHKPFPHSLTPEQRERHHPAVSLEDAMHDGLRNKRLAEEWRPVVGHPKYEVNRAGDLRYLENKTPMAPSMGVPGALYYPLLDAENVVHLTPITVILDKAFPEERD